MPGARGRAVGNADARGDETVARRGRGWRWKGWGSGGAVSLVFDTDRFPAGGGGGGGGGGGCGEVRAAWDGARTVRRGAGSGYERRRG